MTEIERKFLVSEAPELAGCPAKEILQGYLAVTEDAVEIRLRRKGSLHLLTVKKPLAAEPLAAAAGLAREETEVELSREQFEALWPATIGRRVEKRRHSLPVDGGIAEVDFYGGDLAGLITAEVELPTLAAAAAFVPPSWMGPEVTSDARYKNRNLALHGLPRAEKSVWESV